MKLGLNLKNGKKKVFTQQETDVILKNLNYMKLIRFLMGEMDPRNATLDIAGKSIPLEEVYSIEFIV